MTVSEVSVLIPAGMSRRRVLQLVAGSGVAGAVRPAAAQAATLNLFTYPTYASEPLIALGTEKKLSVRTTVYSGGDEMLAKLRGGGTKLFDMVVPVHNYVELAANAGLIEPMDPAKLHNLTDVVPEFRSIPSWSPGGTFYGVPFVWGANALAFTYPQTGAVDSLDVLFDAKWKGRVSMRDDVEDAIEVGALYLGIKDPFNLDEQALQQVKKLLIAQKANNRAYWKNIADLRAMFANGEVVAAWATLSVVAPVRKNGVDIRWVWPKEGALGWSEGISAVKGTRNKAAVEAYADFTISPEYGDTLARQTLYATTSATALKQLPAELVEQLGIQPQRMCSVLFKRTPPNKARWDEIWTEVKLA